MGRNRRERREAQAQRAVENGSPEAIAALVTRSPEIAAQKLAEMASKLPPEPSPLDETALSLCEALRRAGKLTNAIKLAQAFAPRSSVFRLLVAMWAFSAGDDARASELATSDPNVAAVMRPLLDAARAASPRGPVAAAAAGLSAPITAGHNDAPAPKRDRKRAGSDVRSPTLRALHALAEATRAASLGEERSAKTAIAALRKATNGVSNVPVDEMIGALKLVAGEERAVSSICSSALFRRNKGAARAAVRAIARLDARVALAACDRLGVPPADVGDLRRLLALNGATGGDPVLSALATAREAGAGAFATEHQGNAAVYEGFAHLHGDPKRAARAFDRAVELGGDLLEALRGKLILATTPRGEKCPGCGQIHEAGATTPRDVGLAADRFARAARHSHALPFAVAAGMCAADAWIAQGDAKAALASIQAARAAAGDSAPIRDELVLLESLAINESEPVRACGLLDEMLARDPQNVRAWNAKIELIGKRGVPKQTGDLIIEAAKATRDPSLVATARRLRVKRGEIAPFTDMTPGVLSPGAMVLDLQAFMTARGPKEALPAAALASRAALSPPARLAFDAAHVALIVNSGEEGPAAKELLVRLLLEWASAPTELAKLAAVTWCLGLEEQLSVAARKLIALHDRPTAAVDALFEAALAAEDRKIASNLLNVAAPLFSRSELKERTRRMNRLGDNSYSPPFLRAVLGESAPEKKAPNPDEASRAIGALLSPEVDAASVWFGESEAQQDPDDDGPDDEDLDAFDAFGGPSIDPMFADLGLTPGVLRRLPRAQIEKIVRVLEKGAHGPPTMARYQQLRREIQEIIRDR